MRASVARAAMFPSISLGLAGGYQSIEAPLISTPTHYWALGPLATVINLFDGGRRKAQIAMSRAQYEELAAEYRGAVLGAFLEVEDALALARTLSTQATDQTEAANAAAETERLALARYRNGASDYLDVVTAQTAGLQAERIAISTRIGRQRAAIALVRAIGGGLASSEGVLGREALTFERSAGGTVATATPSSPRFAR